MLSSLFSTSIPQWFIPIILSAVALGFYDITKKHAVNNNAVMPVLFLATLTGSLIFAIVTISSGKFNEAFYCSFYHWILILIKSCIVSSSWICVYYGMRELPISIASPIRAASPLWTFIGGLILFSELPSWGQLLGMVTIFAGYYMFSVIGNLEGFSLRHKGMWLIFAGSILGAISALYDKYLLNVLQIPRLPLQFHFSIDLVAILGITLLIRTLFFKKEHQFVWKWSIPITGALLILADYIYFYAVSLPDIQIAILSLIRRSNCIITFIVGAKYFHDKNLSRKAFALFLILLGVTCIALAK